MATTTIGTPDFTDVVNRQIFVEPLSGPQDPRNYLDRFPEAIYNTSIDSHLVKFLYTLLGSAGVGWLRQNYLEARLILEEIGIDGFDLDAFYADPLKFARTLEEVYDTDPTGLLSDEEWQAIKAKDAAYRARCLDYVKGLRAGNTPLGIYYVSKSGLGHDVDIIENFRYIYDQHTDDPLGLANYGSTDSTEEFTVLPKRELSQSEIQQLNISAEGGTFYFQYQGAITVDLDFDASNTEIKAALEAIIQIGPGNITLSGGPLPLPVDIQFINQLSNRDVDELVPVGSLTGSDQSISIETIQGGIDSSTLVEYIPERDQRHLLTALSYIKPQTSIISFSPGAGESHRTNWNTLFSSSETTSVIKYVTGNPNIDWPALDSVSWIEKNVEHQGLRSKSDLQHSYSNFHKVARSWSYGQDVVDGSNYNDVTHMLDGSISNEKIGPFSQYQTTLYSPLRPFGDPNFVFSSSFGLASVPNVSLVTGQVNDVTIIDQIYPMYYQNLPGVPTVPVSNVFWASIERTDGNEYYEVDLGVIQAINYISFQTTLKPYDLTVYYDNLSLNNNRRFIEVTPAVNGQYTNRVGFIPGSINPWQTINLDITNSAGGQIFTQFIRFKFARRQDATSPFVSPGQNPRPFSIEISNLRVGRVVAS